MGALLVACGSDGESMAGPSAYVANGAGEVGDGGADGTQAPSAPSANDAGGSSGTQDASAGGSEAGTSVNAISGLPCEVGALVSTYCVSCHGNTPLPGVSVSLTSYAGLTAMSSTVPGESVAARSLARMQAGTMPPAGPKPSASELSAFAAWVSAGAPDTGCATGGPVVVDPYATPVQCSSNTHWNGRESETMRPGEACTSCHARDPEAPKLSIAGTLYPTAHEPDDCNGSAQPATVHITDNNGTVHTLTSNAAGNFLLEKTIALPYTASVSYGGRTRSMLTPQTSGDCNQCHTTAGASGAPGRIMLP
jgi:cytochrome c553